ncbi:unnamed protein product [Cochlearia groenlandica]
MPSGSKKRKALKKKQKEQEAIGSNSFNGHDGNDEHGSQEEGESDGSLSSPGSQGNGESWTRDSSPSPLSGLKKVNNKETTTEGEDIIAVMKAASQEAVSEAVISNKDKNVESSAYSFCMQQKLDESEEKHRLNEAKEARERSKESKRAKESEKPECSEEKSLSPSGPQVSRTSWLSCCGLFDVMAGSER